MSGLDIKLTREQIEEKNRVLLRKVIFDKIRRDNGGDLKSIDSHYFDTHGFRDIITHFLPLLRKHFKINTGYKSLVKNLEKTVFRQLLKQLNYQFIRRSTNTKKNDGSYTTSATYDIILKP